MTKKELEKENTELKEALKGKRCNCMTYLNFKDLEQENEQLKAQIERMKCCGNCMKGNCVNIGQKGKACAYWNSNELRR